MAGIMSHTMGVIAAAAGGTFTGTAALTNRTVNSVIDLYLGSHAGFRLTRAGLAQTLVELVGSWATVSGEWVASGATSTIGDTVEVRATLSSGATPSGTLDTWQTVDTDRAWGNAVAAGGFTSSSVILIEIRDKGDESLLASATITLTSTE